MNYTIHECSGYSANYRPENVLRNEPQDQASRWSSAANDQNQFLTLKLNTPVLLDSIILGKFHKVHVCNLKEFCIYGGPSPQAMKLLVHSGLNNDTEPEAFIPDYSTSTMVPVQFIKLVPVAAWGSNFNFSIWYIELRGWDDPSLVAAQSAVYAQQMEREQARAVLKYLRDRPVLQVAYQAMQSATDIQLEDPLVSRLRTLIVEDASEEALKAAENLLVDDFLVAHPNAFDEYLSNHVPWTAVWTESCNKGFDAALSADYLDENGDYRMGLKDECPCPRGGHQLVWEPRSRSLLLLGGWSGARDLGDFWRCRVPLNDSDSLAENLRWELISPDVAREGGPSPRSCHKAALHIRLNRLYVLGRYLEPENRPSTDPALLNDFYCYHLDAEKWELISGDVVGNGGPPCVYDHQMVIDEDQDVIWVFGGRSLNSSPADATSTTVYAGLYKYEIRTNRWTLIRPDPVNQGPSQLASRLPTIPSRIGHSMLFDSTNLQHPRSLLILAGQRHKDYLADYYRYDVENDAVWQAGKSIEAQGGPSAGFTQRAVIDPARKEVYLYSGLMRNASSGAGQSTAATEASGLQPSENFFWCWQLQSNRWSPIPSVGLAAPSPRFAHQLAYDPVTSLCFLFGGNPGITNAPNRRLGDFWVATLRKQRDAQDLVRRCRYLLRAAIFHSLVRRGETLRAVQYLQQDLAAAVNHNNPSESAAFRALSSTLFSQPPHSLSSVALRETFEEIVKFLPQVMQPPFQAICL